MIEGFKPPEKTPPKTNPEEITKPEDLLSKFVELLRSKLKINVDTERETIELNSLQDVLNYLGAIYDYLDSGKVAGETIIEDDDFFIGKLYVDASIGSTNLEDRLKDEELVSAINKFRKTAQLLLDPAGVVRIFDFSIKGTIDLEIKTILEDRLFGMLYRANRSYYGILKQGRMASYIQSGSDIKEVYNAAALVYRNLNQACELIQMVKELVTQIQIQQGQIEILRRNNEK